MAKETKIEPSVSNDKSPEVEQELSQVATNPKQNILILVGIVLVFGYLFFSMFLSSGDVKKEETKIPVDVSKPIQVSADNDIPSIPTLPTPPKLEDLTPPAPPEEIAPLPQIAAPLPTLPVDTPIVTDSVNFPTTKLQTDEEKKRLAAKRKSSIVLVAGTPPTKTAEQLQQEADFTHRGDMTLVLGRGKLIDAVIETAINTDFGGEVRAVIIRDIYSEWGKNILIPKGSRIFGNYATGISGAYGRIGIEWTRVDLASGYTLNLSGTGNDSLGRKGIQGRVDQKFKERFSNAVLRSAFNIGLAKGLDALVKPQLSSEDAANRTATATNIKNIANGIFAQTTLSEDTRRVQICASIQSSIEDKTSSAYTQIVAACTAAATSTPPTPLAAFMATINTAADSLLVNTTTSVEETKSQAASKAAYGDISDTLKSFVEEQDFKPTITVDQGTPIKIYVNKDYKFPKAAIKNSGVLK